LGGSCLKIGCNCKAYEKGGTSPNFIINSLGKAFTTDEPERCETCNEIHVKFFWTRGPPDAYYDGQTWCINCATHAQIDMHKVCKMIDEAPRCEGCGYPLIHEDDICGCHGYVVKFNKRQVIPDKKE
jgi:hypothetical protein